MTGDLIKSYLVGLGFGVDDQSLAKFNKAISSAALRVSALFASTQIAATGIVAGIAKVSEGFEQLGYEYKIIAPAINKAIVLRQEMLKAYSAAGVNLVKVVQASVKLNLSLTKTKYAFEAIYRSVASRFFELITKQSDTFRQKIYANMPKIQLALENFVKVVFKALEIVTALGVRLWSILTRVFDFFVSLDNATQGWSSIILGVIAAWKLLNLSFLATPLGLIITGLVAILALFDDFKTWQEGGKSLFDWTKFVPVIDAVTKALQSMWAILQAITVTLSNLILAFAQLYQGDTGGFWESLKAVGESVISVFARIWDNLKNIAGVISAVGTFGKSLFGNSNAQANLQNTASGAPRTPPLGAGSSNNSLTNQHVQQQTTINVQGSSDANAVGKHVSGEQSRVNLDLARYLKGAVQ